MEDSPGAHRTRFESGIERATEEPVILQKCSGEAEGDNFGMGGGIGCAEHTILSACDDFARSGYDDSAYRDLACGFCGSGFGHCFEHERSINRQNIGKHREQFYYFAGGGATGGMLWTSLM